MLITSAAPVVGATAAVTNCQNPGSVRLFRLVAMTLQNFADITG
jgi:hypothetical protein